MQRRAPDVAKERSILADTTAAAAMALVQHHAIWEALTTLALITETVAARRSEGLEAVGEAVASVLDDIGLTDIECDRSLQLLQLVDQAARAWAGRLYGPPELRIV